jgi:AcrR family transcriptional regulator
MKFCWTILPAIPLNCSNPVDRLNPAPRRRLPPEVRKLEILEAAERLLEVHGSQVRVEDVVREAGVAKGTFFLYFPTWDDLLETIRDRVVAQFDAAHPWPTLPPTDWIRLVESQAVAFVDFTLSRQGIGAAIFHSDLAERRPPAEDGAGRLATVIRAGQAAGAFGDAQPEPTARLLFAVIHEAADAIAGGAEREPMVGALKRVLRRTLAP